jgi:hypothetical protein
MPGTNSRNRYYSAPPSLHNVSTIYGWTETDVSTNGITLSGAWTPLSVESDGTLNVRAAGLSFSGDVSITAVAITGSPVVSLTGNQTVTVANTAPIPVSGVVVANVSVVDTGNRSVQVANTAPINVTGIVHTVVTGSVSTSFDPTAIVNAQSTGNNLNVISNQLLSGISGALTTNLSAAAWVTGQTYDVVSRQLLSGISGLLASNLTEAAWVTGRVSISEAINVAITGGRIETIVTGAVSASVDTTSVVLAQSTGNSRLLVSNALLSGISGLLAGNLTDVALVNDVTGNLYLAAISGYLANQAAGSNPVGVTGTRRDLNIVYASSATGYYFLPVGGRAVAASGAGAATGYNTGDFVTFNFNKDNGALLVNQGALDYTQDTVTISGIGTGVKLRVENTTATVTSSSTPSGLAPFTSDTRYFGQALAANSNRVTMFIQNTHTGLPLYVNLGTTAASTGVFSMILNPSTVQGWGGSSFSTDRYRGAVQASGGSWIAWEL